MKKKRQTVTKRTSNRMPPSIPKCLSKQSDGYITDFITSVNGTASLRFTIRKTGNIYSVFKYSAISSETIDMANDLSISPTTRKLFSNITTLKTAVAAIETYIGRTLPEVR